VPAGFFEKKERESLIKATLKPNQKIDPAWARISKKRLQIS
jgi:hypothetical protein